MEEKKKQGLKHKKDLCSVGPACWSYSHLQKTKTEKGNERKKQRNESEKCYMCFVSAISQAQRCVAEKEKEKTVSEREGGGGY